MPFLLPPCAHLEVLLEANGQYLGHGWGQAPGAGAGARAGAGGEAGRPPVLPSRRRKRRRRGALAGMAPGAPAALLGLSAGPLTRRDHSAPHQPARVSSNSPSLWRFFLRPSPPPLARPYPPAFLNPAISLLLRAPAGNGAVRERVVPAAATASGEGREGLSECRYPSATATHAHMTRPPPRLPLALPPADPQRGPGLLLTPPHPDAPGLPPDPPDPPGLLPTHPPTVPLGPSRPTLPPALRVSSFPCPQPRGGAGATLPSALRDSRRR